MKIRRLRVAAVCDVAELQTRAAPVMPGYCYAGSVNFAAAAGLAAGCQWLAAPAQQGRLRAARGLASALTESVRQMPGVTVHHDAPMEYKLPTVAISVSGAPSTDLADQLRVRGLLASGGFQCAPQAHRALGTAESGVLRFSFGPSNHPNDVHRAIQMLDELLNG